MRVELIRKERMFELETEINKFIKDKEVCSVSISSHAYVVGYTSNTYYIACILYK